MKILLFGRHTVGLECPYCGDVVFIDYDDHTPNEAELLLEFNRRHWWHQVTSLCEEPHPYKCPFCGGEAKRSEETFGTTFDSWVYCTSCGAQGPPRHTEREAVTAWNTRVTRR